MTIMGFTNSTARCGTVYIVRMLQELKVGRITHEPRHDFLGSGTNHLGDSANSAWLKKSKPRITNSISKSGFYFESDMAFIQATYYYVCRDFDHRNIRVVELSRPLEKVVKSIADRALYYKGTNVRRLLHYKNFFNITIPPENPSHLDYVCWYIHEIEARKLSFRKKYKDVLVFQFNLDTDAGSIGRWEELLNFLELDITDKFKRIVKENPIIHSLRPYVKMNYPIEECKEALKNYTVIQQNHPLL